MSRALSVDSILPNSAFHLQNSIYFFVLHLIYLFIIYSLDAIPYNGAHLFLFFFFFSLSLSSFFPVPVHSHLLTQYNSIVCLWFESNTNRKIIIGHRIGIMCNVHAENNERDIRMKEKGENLSHTKSFSYYISIKCS